MVGLNVQIVRPQLDRHVPVAQVVSGAGQVKRRAMLRAGGDPQHALRRSLHADQRAVFGHQHIAAAHHAAAWQKHAHAAAQGVDGFEAAFLAQVPVQRHRGGAFHEDLRQALALGNQFGNVQHQNKK